MSKIVDARGETDEQVHACNHDDIAQCSLGAFAEEVFVEVEKNSR